VPRADIRYSGNPVGSNELGAHPGREMREDEEHTEPIMRHEADIPPVLDEAGGRARREVPPSVDAEIGPCENEDRIHVTQHVKGKVDARSDLEICGSRC